MGRDTYGKLKGYVKHEDIFEFIKNNYDENAACRVDRTVHRPLSYLDWEYTINEHSDDNVNWYDISGFIYFKYNGENRMLHYFYDNIVDLSDLEYYSEHGLEDFVKAEKTHIGLSYWGSSVEIIKEILEHFDGGWIDENDCDDEEYYWVEAKHSGTQTVPEVWDRTVGEFVGMPESMKRFLEDIRLVCKKHGLSISTEEGFNESFLIEPYSESNIEHLFEANKNY